MDNRQMVQGIFEQMAAGNTRALVDALAEDCSWTFPGEWSWAGTWAPKQVVMDELLTPLFAQFADRYRSEADFVLADGDRVVVQARGRVTTKRGGDYRQTYCFVFRVRDGRIAEVIEHCDTALVERLLEPPASVSGAARAPTRDLAILAVAGPGR